MWVQPNKLCIKVKMSASLNRFLPKDFDKTCLLKYITFYSNLTSHDTSFCSFPNGKFISRVKFSDVQMIQINIPVQLGTISKEIVHRIIDQLKTHWNVLNVKETVFEKVNVSFIAHIYIVIQTLNYG